MLRLFVHWHSLHSHWLFHLLPLLHYIIWWLLDLFCLWWHLIVLFVCCQMQRLCCAAADLKPILLHSLESMVLSHVFKLMKSWGCSLVLYGSAVCPFRLYKILLFSGFRPPSLHLSAPVLGINCLVSSLNCPELIPCLFSLFLSKLWHFSFVNHSYLSFFLFETEFNLLTSALFPTCFVSHLSSAILIVLLWARDLSWFFFLVYSSW